MAHFFAPERFTLGDLTIRTYYPGDGPALRDAAVSSYEHLRPWMAWARSEQTVEESEWICRRAYANYLLNTDFVLSIWVNNELAGGSGFHLRGGPFEIGNAEIGMWISARYAGQGVGTRALAAILRWGFTEWAWQRLTWHCDTRNIGSKRVAEKNGMVLEGTFRADAFDITGERRDTHVFSLLRHEWEAGNRGQGAGDRL